ncbi:uncharacterized protein LOC135434976 [Drosophila montana]|uniref:uncharacterized protein LOC135434976 n=1 Tax=Drosophila montana TaxID=40370 RepID=UPI00313AF395
MANQLDYYLKGLVNTLLFMLNRQEFHLHQIRSEENRLKKSILKSASDHRKQEHITHIQEYKLLLDESTSQLQKQQDKLQKYLDSHPDLNESELYQQAGNVLKDMHL